MEATIKLKVSELDENLFQKIKKLFEGKSVTITISSDEDETSYLLSNAENEKFLLESMAEEPSVSFTIEEFEKRVNELNK
jgi:uncharacterized protein (DUF2249 family)